VTMLPELVLRNLDERIVLRPVDGLTRAIYAVTRAADAARPSTQALLAAVRDAVEHL
jgi:hypothetical protein